MDRLEENNNAKRQPVDVKLGQALAFPPDQASGQEIGRDLKRRVEPFRTSLEEECDPTQHRQSQGDKAGEQRKGNFLVCVPVNLGIGVVGARVIRQKDNWWVALRPVGRQRLLVRMLFFEQTPYAGSAILFR